MNVYQMLKDIYTREIEDALHGMKTFAVTYGVYDEYMDQIMHSKYFDSWCRQGIDVLVKRFGFFVLENMDKMKIPK
jgi:hypothetical protein